MVSDRAWGALLAVAALLALATGAVAAQEPAVHPLTTADEAVPARVPVTVGWLLTNDEGEPAFHQDARFEVRFENETLLATTPASGHDYDGVDPYQVAFPEPGNFTVTAQVHDDGEVRELTYEGQVGPAPERRLDVELEAPEHTSAGRLVDFAATVTGPEGEPVDGVEVTFRVQRSIDRFEVLKTRTSVDDGTARLTYAFDRAAIFEVTAIAHPVPGEGPDLAAATATHTLAVAKAETPAARAPVERPLLNDRETGERGDEGFELFGTYDPYTSVGPHGRIRLGMLTLDEATGRPAEDVAYRASILDPDGQLVFRSSDLDAADGFEYVTTSRLDPGTYEMRVDAAKDGWRDHVVLQFTVLPPAAATNAGPLSASPNASTSLDARSPATFPIQVEDAAGAPLTHGEVDVRFVDADTGVPTVAGKLHVHENGTLPLTVAPIDAGAHRLDLLPQSLQPAPTPYTYGEELGQPPTFAVDVAGSVADDALEEQSGSADRGVPGLDALAVLGALGLAAAKRGRR